MKKNYVRTGVCLMLLVLGFFLHADTDSGWIYVLNRNEGVISVVDVADGKLATTITLDGKNPLDIYQAPSGKYVFVTFQGSEQISVFDTEEHRQVKTLSLQNGAPEGITFSPMGEWVYAIRETSNQVTVFHHKKLVLEPASQFSLGHAGAPIVFNRRGTRFYRSDSEGLLVIYAKDRKVIKKIRVAQGPRIWAFTPDYRYLWGVGVISGAVVVIDEKKARIAKILDLKSKPHSPVFSEDGKQVYLIDRTGERVVVLDSRSYKVVGDVAFPKPISSIVYSHDGRLWAIGEEENTVFVADLAALKVERKIPLGGIPHKILYVKLKKGAGFACF